MKLNSPPGESLEESTISTNVKNGPQPSQIRTTINPEDPSSAVVFLDYCGLLPPVQDLEVENTVQTRDGYARSSSRFDLKNKVLT